ncbi:MAG: hypothetical protein M1497_10020 [Nitrospirae bacterium]|nr:hypothetical protein [Nitrospirota bacterium]
MEERIDKIEALVHACKDCGKDFTVFLCIKEYEADRKSKDNEFKQQYDP